MKSKLEIYALAVCFASMICLVISFGVAGYGVFEIATPSLTMSSYKYEKFQTNDSYYASKGSCCSKDKEKDVRPPEDVLTKQRLEAFAVETKGEQREGLQSIIKCMMFIAASGIALAIHWAIAKRARSS